MPSGGARKNSGKKKGSINARTKAIREVADKALRSGLTPLDVMMKNMRFYAEEAKGILDEIMKVVAEAQGSVPDEGTLKEINRLLGALNSAKLNAQNCASDAAPYVHAKISSVTLSGPKGGPIQQILGTMTPAQAAEAYASTLKG